MLLPVPEYEPRGSTPNLTQIDFHRGITTPEVVGMIQNQQGFVKTQFRPEIIPVSRDFSVRHPTLSVWCVQCTKTVSSASHQTILKNASF